ncbi:hypothetical protein Nepgr_032664 [Nepenthes gracilis]|uniref:Uncharacterized protein n=1 Tax=Nepenthes gracilis TaxID=150966 RepID=A0AAD3TKI1_NEPGR|nr:hypothetical protein Nepgr_032664 [Nepenthes gracilis]
MIPARTVLRNITSKFQIKLHKLNKSKIIKKPKNLFKLISRRRSIFYPSLSLPFKSNSYHHQKQPQFRPSPALRRLGHHHHLIRKHQRHYPPPIYVDELSTGMMAPHNDERSRGAAPGVIVESKEDNGKTEAVTADEFWESVMLASPLMRGVDARAEEFIARFRAELEFQKMITHRL